MPQIWNNMVVVTIDELIPTFFPSWKALKLKLWRDSKKGFWDQTRSERWRFRYKTFD